MKTAEQTLHEWVIDEITFDYSDGRGPVVHSRSEFIAICARLEACAGVTILASGQPIHIGSGVAKVSQGQVHSNPVSGRISPAPHGPMLSTGMISSGAIRLDNPLSYLEKCNTTVLDRIGAAAKTYLSLFEARIGDIEQDRANKVCLFFDARNLARYSTAREVITTLVEAGIKRVLPQDIEAPLKSLSADLN